MMKNDNNFFFTKIHYLKSKFKVNLLNLKGNLLNLKVNLVKLYKIYLPTKG
jgi:hypothetical protein